MNDNLKYGKLNNIKTLGIFFGSFSPAHKAHYATVVRASMENDAALVIVSGRNGDYGESVGLPLNRRFRYMREVVAKEGNISVEQLDETHIPAFPDGWNEWIELMLEKITHSVDDYHSIEKITWYVGDTNYKNELEKRLNQEKHTITLIDKTTIPISTDHIRKAPRVNWRYILKPFRRAFTKKVLICGTASGGKTTLTRKLATLYGTAYSEEYAREYQQRNNVRDNELDRNDYLYLATGQFENNKQAIWSDANSGLVFCDTNVLVTEMYAREDFGDTYDKSVFTRLMSNEKWDLIFVIPPTTKYIDDGFRNMEQASNENRLRMHQMLIDILTEYQLDDKIVILDREDEVGSYYARFEQAQEVIQELFDSLK